MDQVRFTGFHEGERPGAYIDSEGHWTIGYGHKMKPGLESMLAKSMGAALRITAAQTKELLDMDLAVAREDYARLFGAMGDAINPARRIVLTDMLFNLGRGGFLQFTNTIKAIRAGDWSGAADRALLSKWAEQVGTRARRVAYVLKHGAFAPERHKLYIADEGLL